MGNSNYYRINKKNQKMIIRIAMMLAFATSITANVFSSRNPEYTQESLAISATMTIFMAMIVLQDIIRNLYQQQVNPDGTITVIFESQLDQRQIDQEEMDNYWNDTAKHRRSNPPLNTYNLRNIRRVNYAE